MTTHAGAAAADALEQIKRILQDVFGLNSLEVDSLCRHPGHKHLVQTPRHGANVEFNRYLQEIGKEGLTKRPGGAAELFEETWRDAEKRVRAPHTFAVLKQVPELQQLIAYTAVPVITAAGAPESSHFGSVALAGSLGTLNLIRQDLVAETGGAAQGTAETAAAAAAAAADAAQPPSIDAALAAAAAAPVGNRKLVLFGVSKQLRKHVHDLRQINEKQCQDSVCGLLPHMTPHMRLALAAEVAAGMLCPGQPPPPDTPEHGCLLKLFVGQAFQQLEQELLEHSALLLQASSGGSSSSMTCSNDATSLQQTWAHVDTSSPAQPQPPQSSNQSPAAAGGDGTTSSQQQLLPPPDKVRSWALSPHIDLQLQVPPLQLLQQAAAVAATLHQQHTQQQGQQQLPDDAQQALAQAQLQELAQQLVQQPAFDVGVTSSVQSLLSTASTNWLQTGLSAVSEAGASETAAGSSSSSTVIQQVVSCSSQLAARCLLELTAAVSNAGGGQQDLPLHALQLLSSVQGLLATAQRVEVLHQAAASGSSGSDSNSMSLAAVQRQVVCQALMLCELVRSLRGETAVPLPAGTSNGAAAPHQAGSSSNSSSAGPAEMPPHLFFAGNGPLAHSGQQQPDRGQQQHQVLAAVAASAVAHGAVTAQLANSNMWDAEEFQLLLLPDQLLACMKQLGGGLKVAPTIEEYVEILAVKQLIQQQMHVRKHPKPSAALAVHLLKIFPVFVVHLRVCLWQRLGFAPYDVASWQQAMCRGQLAVMTNSTDQGRDDSGNGDGSSSGSGSGTDSGDGSGSDRASDSDSGSGSGSDSSSDAAGSSAAEGTDTAASATDDGAAAVAVSENFLQRLHAALDSAGVPHTEVQEDLGCCIMQGGVALGDMASAAAAKLAPLQQWHSQQVQRQQEAASQAHKWSEHPQRQAMIKTAADSVRNTKELRSTGSSGRGRQHAAADKAAAAAAAAVAGGCNSSKCIVLQPGQHDHLLECSLCRRDMQEKQQSSASGASSSSGSSSTSATSSTNESSTTSNSNSPYSCWPVAYDDPFLWRRLLWRLLGKLSPEAQAFYATYLAMCPHCNDGRLWTHVYSCMSFCLWSPPDASTLDLWLSLNDRSELGRTQPARLRAMRQYSRALHSAFAQSYQASTSLVAKQVLLALSPLHHQVLPPPETAHYLPSSFGPGIGKALMQQLLDSSTPVLDGFAHEHCRLQLWHVWWHVGLRQHQLLQQKQQHMQQLSSLSKPRTASSGSNGSSNNSSSSGGGGSAATAQPPAGGDGAASSSSSSHCANPSACDDLYLDADARLSAVGYAMQRLSQSGPHVLRQQSAASIATSAAVRAVQDAFCSSSSAALSPVVMEGFAFTADALKQLVSLLEPRGGDLATVLTKLTHDMLVAPALLPRVRQLLLEATAGPADLLVPVEQQRGARPFTGDEAYAVISSIHADCRFAARAYINLAASQLQHAQAGPAEPPPPAAAAATSRAGVRGAAAPAAAPSDPTAAGEAAPAAGFVQEQEVVSEAAALMLADPVPVECLVGPEVWWAWHQSLAKLSACDVCATEIMDRNRAVACAGCSSAVYCSETCRSKDGGHDLICGKLVAAQQRYSAGGGSSSSSTSAGSSRARTLAATASTAKQQPGRIPGLPVLSGLLQPAVFELPAVSAPGQLSCSFVGVERVITELARALEGPKMAALLLERHLAAEAEAGSGGGLA